MQFCEILVISPKDESLILRLKHFSSELIGWEDKEKRVEFPLVAITENEAKFDGLLFRRISPDEMHIIVNVGQGGQSREIKFECQRVKGGAPSAP